MGLNIGTVKTGTKTAKAVWHSAEHSNDPLPGRNPGQGTGSAFSNIRAFSGPLAIVDGLVQGDVYFAGGLVFVGPGGKCKGSVKAHRLRIEGEVQGGTVDVDTITEVLPEGRLSARITHGKVDASPGAILDVAEEPALPKAPAAPSPTKVRVAFKGGFKS